MNRNLIFFNTEITPIRKLLLMHVAAGGKLIDYTVTGNPVSFSTNVAKPLSVLAAFSPVQAGSGDPSPENVRPITGFTGASVYRTGANLLDNNRIADMNVGTDLTGERKAVSFTKPGKYYVKALRTWNEAYLYARVKNADGTFGNILYVVANTTVQNKTVTLTEGQTLIMFNASTGINGTVEKTIERFEGWGIVVSFEDMTEYAPYTGQSYPVTFPAMGKNLLNIEDTAKVVPGVSGSTITIENGVISIDAIAASSRTYVVFNQKLPAGTYTIQAKETGAVSLARLLTSVEISGSSFNSFYLMYVRGIGENGLTFTLPSESYIGLNLNNAIGESGNPGSVYDIQIEKGETATAYEPFTNTAYGGTLDPSTGVLTVEWAEIDLGSLNYYVMSQGEGIAFVCDTGITFGGRDFVCNQYKTIVSPYWTSMTDNSIMAHPTANYLFRVRDDRYTDKDVFKAAMAEQGAKLVYPLATPLVYQLSPVEILSLVGDNVLWSDLNGDLTVTYKKKG